MAPQGQSCGVGQGPRPPTMWAVPRLGGSTVSLGPCPLCTKPTAFPRDCAPAVLQVEVKGAEMVWEPVKAICRALFSLFLERGEGMEKERERNISVWFPPMLPTGDLARNPGMCPDWESNW